MYTAAFVERRKDKLSATAPEMVCCISISLYTVFENNYTGPSV